MLAQHSRMRSLRQGQCFRSQRPSRPAKLVVHNAAAVTLSETEAAALGKYKATQLDSRDRCMSLLKQAAYSNNIDPELVEGALVFLEEITPAGPRPSVNGTWRLVFGTASKFRPFQYIPVKENFVIDVEGSRLALESSIGPFEFFIKGQLFGWDGAAGVLDFQFNEVDITCFNKLVKQIKPTTKRKTYTWFYMDDDLAAARSSTGGMALLRRIK